MPGTAAFRAPYDAPPSPRPAKWWQTLTGELLLLVIVAALFRLLVLSRTPLIARDGMLYVGMARTINHGMWLDLVGDWFLFNPYPAMIAWLNRCGLDFEFAGQLISAAASTIAVIPLYLWCRDAFDRRIGQLTALTYAMHPVVLRFSGQVLREGLYWCCMLWGVYLFWVAARRRSWPWYVAAGAMTTAATLTRMEGAVILGLGALWTWGLPALYETERKFWPTVSKALCNFRSWALISLSWAMVPICLMALNILFIPAGQGWHGFGRWAHMLVRVTTGQELAPKANKVPDRMVYIVADEKARAASVAPPVQTVRQLAKSLPAWNPLGEPDPQVLRLQRFLILADDQQQFLIIGRFLNECWDGLLFPCVLCWMWGLYACRAQHWNHVRDWPLAIASLVLSALLMYHLATEFILEPRYMLCLIPFVFPWSAIGARDLYLRIEARAAQSVFWSRRLPRPQVLAAVLVVCAIAKLSLGMEERSKVFQKELGSRLRQAATKRLKIAGPESLKRVAHYADADYFIIPRGDLDSARRWLDTQPLDLVILSHDDMPVAAAATDLLPENSPRYRHWTADETRSGKIEVYSVSHGIRQVGS